MNNDIENYMDGITSVKDLYILFLTLKWRVTKCTNIGHNIYLLIMRKDNWEAKISLAPDRTFITYGIIYPINSVQITP